MVSSRSRRHCSDPEAVWQLPGRGSGSWDCDQAPPRFTTEPLVFDSGAGAAVVVGLNDHGVLVYDAAGTIHQVAVGDAQPHPFGGGRSNPLNLDDLFWFFVIGALVAGALVALAIYLVYRAAKRIRA